MSFLYDIVLCVINVEEIEFGGECLFDNYVNFRNKVLYFREKKLCEYFNIKNVCNKFMEYICLVFLF